MTTLEAQLTPAAAASLKHLRAAAERVTVVAANVDGDFAIVWVEPTIQESSDTDGDWRRVSEPVLLHIDVRGDKARWRPRIVR